MTFFIFSMENPNFTYEQEVGDKLSVCVDKLLSFLHPAKSCGQEIQFFHTTK